MSKQMIDLRMVLDPLAAIRAARPAAQTVMDPAGTERQVAAVDPAQLPPVATVRNDETGAMQIDVVAQLALLQAAVARITDGQLRGVHASKTFTSTLIWAAGDTRDIPLTWETAPLAPCRYATVRMDVGIAWQGKLSASVKAGSVTDAGCTVQVTATVAVVITLGSPLTVHADGTYQYWPPYEGTST